MKQEDLTTVHNVHESEKDIVQRNHNRDKMTQQPLTSFYLFCVTKNDRFFFSKPTKGHEQHEVVET